MAEPSVTQDDLYDPMHVWREYFNSQQGIWSDYVRNTVGVMMPADAQGTLADPFLGFQQAVRNVMRAPLSMLNVPTAEEVSSVGKSVERMQEDVARAAREEDVAGLTASLSDLKRAVSDLGNLVNVMAKRFDQIEQRLSVGEQRAVALAMLPAKTDDLGKRLGKAEQVLDGLPSEIDRRLGKLDRHLAAVDASNDGIRKDVDKLEKQLSGLKEPLGAIDKKIGQLDKRLGSMEKVGEQRDGKKPPKAAGGKPQGGA